MASTTSLAIMLAILTLSINSGVAIVAGSGWATNQMGVDGIDLGIGQNIQNMNDAITQNEFTPVAIGSAFAGFTINGIQVLAKVFILMAIGIPAILYTVGAPVWVWSPITTIMIAIQGLAAIGLYFGGEV